MEDFLNAFSNPGVWAGVILTLVLQQFFKHLPKALKGLFQLPKVLKCLFRLFRVRTLRKIKAIRFNQDAVTYQSMKAHAYFLVFVGMCGLFLLLLIIGPFRDLLGMPKMYILVFWGPVFIAEILWLRQSSYAKELIEYRGKLSRKKLAIQ